MTFLIFHSAMADFLSCFVPGPYNPDHTEQHHSAVSVVSVRPAPAPGPRRRHLHGEHAEGRGRALG